MCGGRVIILKGGSNITTMPSIVSTELQLGGKSVVRQLGAMSFYLWLAYGLYMASVEVACGATCAGTYAT